MAGRDEREALEHFRDRYGRADTEVTALVERRVLGASWGANGYTTLEQADDLAARLTLAPGVRLLDLGTGRGWPGLHFATRYGCAVVGSDMPLEGLEAAGRRADEEGVGDRFAAVAAAGARQPFRAGSFDAVVHTDVLC